MDGKGVVVDGTGVHADDNVDADDDVDSDGDGAMMLLLLMTSMDGDMIPLPLPLLLLLRGIVVVVVAVVVLLVAVVLPCTCDVLICNSRIFCFLEYLAVSTSDASRDRPRDCSSRWNRASNSASVK